MKCFIPALLMQSDSWHSFLLEGNETIFYFLSANIIWKNIKKKIIYVFNFSVIPSSLFSGLRGGVFMCTLARLNKRLKHLLFHTLLQQEVQFFDENNPGERKLWQEIPGLKPYWMGLSYLMSFPHQRHFTLFYKDFLPVRHLSVSVINVSV